MPAEIVAPSSEVPAIDKSGAAAPVVIDLGRKTKKKIKDLRKGKPGKLMSQVSDAISQLKAEGIIATNAQPVVIVVRERERNNRNMPSLWP